MAVFTKAVSFRSTSATSLSVKAVPRGGHRIRAADAVRQHLGATLPKDVHYGGAVATHKIHLDDGIHESDRIVHVDEEDGDAAR